VLDDDHEDEVEDEDDSLLDGGAPTVRSICHVTPWVCPRECGGGGRRPRFHGWGERVAVNLHAAAFRRESRSNRKECLEVTSTLDVPKY
jgi:hypothetical protein